MKKTILLFSFVLMLLLFAADRSYGQATFNNTGIFSAGIHFVFEPDEEFSHDQKIPPLMMAYEAGISEYFTLGGVIAYSLWEYENNNISYINLGTKGSYHLTPLINDLFKSSLNESKLDLYATASLVMEMKQHDTIGETEATIFLDDVSINFGIAGGVRYYFSRDTAIFTEVGKGVMGLVCLGVSFRM